MTSLRSVAYRLVPKTAARVEAAIDAFRRAPLDEIRRDATIVFAHDWGADGAQANVEHEIKTIGKLFDTNIDLVTIPGIPALGSPLIAAIEFDRILDTHTITLELCARKLEAGGLSKKEIEKRLPRLVLLNVFDRGVGSERVPAIVEGKLTINGGKDRYEVSVGLVGPINNGIIGALTRRLDSVSSFDLANTHNHVDNLGCITWDGRTKFGPASALYATGIKASDFGVPIDLETQPRIVFQPIADKDRLLVPLVDIDAIGNLVLGVRNGDAEKILKWPLVSFEITDTIRQVARSGSKFSDVEEGELILYKGSNGLLELAINGGNLAAILGLSKEQGHLDLIESVNELRPATILALKQATEVAAIQQTSAVLRRG